MIRLCHPGELAEGRTRGFQVEDLKVFAVRRQGRVHVYRNRCPHRGVPLEWEADRFLDASGALLQCAHHGALFLIESGECIQGPCLGEVLDSLPCREDEQGLWISLPEDD
ncbi:MULTISPECIES: Rieske 2Fe-2S domain-containing protein [Pseudomonas]|jgi:nitrite reductase/ring-hydroxylating ferredoxin subunit|uniref:Rieske (2Fe-2S) protein n=1 Tax=Pseudomonas TaxID=286 RepID=UPI0005B8C8F7|nr:Rieske 2Fe-2S domain-containing protein [Pseudomonas sp. PI1]KWR71865.1 MFS transporter [Pseudomonas sp. PI1]